MLYTCWAFFIISLCCILYKDKIRVICLCYRTIQLRYVFRHFDMEFCETQYWKERGQCFLFLHYQGRLSITGFIYVLEMVGRDSVGPFLHCLLVLRLLIHGALVQVVPKHNVFRLEILTEGSPSFLANFLKFRTEIRNLERHHQHLQEIGLNHLKDQLPCMPKNHFHQSLIVDRVYRRCEAVMGYSKSLYHCLRDHDGWSRTVHECCTECKLKRWLTGQPQRELHLVNAR
nr:uncharacterized protein LOC119165863 isoform X1 [Rhipicephalus microplus]